MHRRLALMLLLMALGRTGEVRAQSKEDLDEPQRNARFQPQTIPAMPLPALPIQQELDAISGPLAKTPADPLFRYDPLAKPLMPIRGAGDWVADSAKINFGATYTFLNQYATITPDGV